MSSPLSPSVNILLVDDNLDGLLVRRSLSDLDDLVFEVKDFNGGSVSGEWLFTLGNYMEGGVGVGFYKRTVPSVYRGFVNADNSEIEQNLRFRVSPVTGSIRFLPMGHGSVEPYVGL